MRLGQIIDVVMKNISKKRFAQIGGLGPKSRPFLIYQTTAINQKPIIMRLGFFTVLKVCSKTIKNSKHHLLKIN